MSPQKLKPTWTLVTGCAGFIAHHLIDRLLHEGRAVLGVDNLDAFYSVEAKRKNLHDLHDVARKTGTPLQVMENDITRLDETWFSGEKIDAVVHLAAKAGVRPSLKEPENYLKVNVQGTLRVLEFCRARGISEMVFGSSSSVYGNDAPVPFSEENPADRPISPYAASKRAAELYCHTYAHLYGMRIAALRLFTVYGPRQRPDLAIHKFAKAISGGHPITLFGDGSTSRDYTFVSDIVEGLFGAMKWAHESAPGTYGAFNLGGSAGTQLKELVSLLEKHLNQPARIEWAGRQAGDVERTLADTSKALKAFGYAPKVKMDEGIARFVEWFRSAVVAKRAA